MVHRGPASRHGEVCCKVCRWIKAFGKMDRVMLSIIQRPGEIPQGWLPECLVQSQCNLQGWWSLVRGRFPASFINIGPSIQLVPLGCLQSIQGPGQTPQGYLPECLFQSQSKFQDISPMVRATFPEDSKSLPPSLAEQCRCE